MFFCNRCCRCCRCVCCCNHSEQRPLGEREVTQRDLEIFREAMEGIVGVIYEPTRVRVRRVSGGLEYRFTAVARIPGPPSVVGEPWLVHIYIFVPREGPAELIDIVRLTDEELNVQNLLF